MSFCHPSVHQLASLSTSETIWSTGEQVLSGDTAAPRPGGGAPSSTTAKTPRTPASSSGSAPSSPSRRATGADSSSSQPSWSSRTFSLLYSRSVLMSHSSSSWPSVS